MTAQLSHEQVAEYLRDNPAFFELHGELLSSITVPHPHGSRAVSLVERQVEVLRERHKALEMRMAEMLRAGQENDAIADRLQRWTRDLLREPDLAALPAVVVDGLREGFSVPQVALRVWRVAEAYRELPAAQPVEPEVVTLTDSFKQPYCGPNADFTAAGWLAGGGADTRSLALLPLRVGFAPESFGLLVLGSPDAERFKAGLGTAFLERIAELASAALSRLTH
jgi:uncharacterized protein